MGLMDVPITLALNAAKGTYINPYLEGIGELEKVSFKNGQLSGVLRLAGMDSEPVEVICSDISIAPDGSGIRIGSLASNKKFADTALKRFAQGREFAIPEGAARKAAITLKGILKI